MQYGRASAGGDRIYHSAIALPPSLKMPANKAEPARTITRQAINIQSILHSLARLASCGLSALVLISPTPAAAMAERPAGSTLEEAFLATPVGPSAGDAIIFTRVLNTLGRTNEAGALQRELLHEYLQHLNGKPPEVSRTFGTLVERGRSRPAVPPDFDKRRGKTVSTASRSSNGRMR